jgi:hypothetical protein
MTSNEHASEFTSTEFSEEFSNANNQMTNKFQSTISKIVTIQIEYVIPAGISRCLRDGMRLKEVPVGPESP